ncbi:prepilin peptidase [Pseudonocardia sp. MH-G8]|uniref:prepilin peptidase n=1 Tax=Pseudonocardia sp. MH-G8 TaxID=1854588 RepID=UPI000B9FAB01|nr:prepilin peptidase [Pseudonocardia sp. MH-G8]OZM78206.1 prepilin peptidase [Pseudonocardia sp. MH-G8]
MAVLAVVLAVAGAVAGAGARLLLGRLRRGARVPVPCCEVAVAVLWAGTGLARAAGLLPLTWLPVLLGLGWLAVAAGAVDVLHRRLPDALTVPALPVALLLLLPVGPAAVVRGAAGAAVAVAVHAAVHLLDRRAVGAGDVKLAASLGAVLTAVAWPALAVAAVLAAVLTAVAGLLGAAGPAGAGAPARRLPRPRSGAAVAHGPSMLAATWLVVTCLAGVGAAGGSGGG